MVITGSANIAILDSRVIVDLCLGKICVDLSPSVYIGSGEENVLGALFQITNPYGVIIKPYGSSYEVGPSLSGGMDAPICFNVPTQAGNYQYGKYKIDVQLFDEGGASWTVTKYVSICEPDKKNKTRSYGSLSAILKGSCKEGKLYVIVDSVPTYNGVIVESHVNDFTLEYPTSSGLPVLETTIGSFSVTLFEGVYKITGTICATYNFGDNVYVNVNYKIKKEKNIRCLIDECCVFAKLSELHLQLKADCTLDEQEKTTNIVVDALRLLKTAQLAADCGEDASDYIAELETLLGCVCTCNCAEGTPIIDSTPSKDFNITGCNVSKSTIGLTDNYIIENYEYEITVAENGGVLVISAPVLDGCTKRQEITFSLPNIYSQNKTLADQNSTEADFWASIVNKSLADIPPDCLGVTQGTWNGWTLKQKITAILEKLCDQVGCDAEIIGGSTDVQGVNVLLVWENSDSVFYVDIYLDGVLMGTVAPGLSDTDIHEFLLENVADGVEHTYTLVPKCENGTTGTPSTGQFVYLGCPDIAPPVVSSNNVNGVDCPYDLTSLESTPPVGITIEWHTANNTNASSLVANPAAVSSGVYYAFAKNTDGCYSMSTQVTLICEAATSCTAPQNLSVTAPLSGTIHIISFQSAAYPPPGNSYTVKRKAAADPDVDGSYTTIGTPTWNVTLNRWVIDDNAVDPNTLYTYKAISNCADSPATTPSAMVNFANLECYTPIPTPHSTSIEYSLGTGDSNEITKYEVKLYDATGTILLHTDTYLPAFSDPETGEFFYLTPSTDYKIVVTAWIGTFSKTSCSTLNTATTA